MTTETLREAVARAICDVRHRYNWTYGLKRQKVMAVDIDLADAAIRTVLERLSGRWGECWTS